MDHFLKGVKNRFAELPAVRLEVRSSRDEVEEVRWETDWPLPSTEYVPLYLHEQTLSTEPAPEACETVYDGESGLAAFDYVFEEDTELIGYMKLRLWVEARPAPSSSDIPDDLIVCCYVEKRDTKNRSLRFNGSVGQRDDMVTRGYARASRRALDDESSTPWNPVMLGSKDEPLAPGDVFPLEVALCPSSTFFRHGERLRLIVSATDFVHAPIFRKDTGVNRGRHVLHSGGKWDAFLLIPRIAREGGGG